MTPEATLLVDAAAVFRLTRLVMDDQAGEPIRKAVRATAHTIGGDSGDEWADALLECAWCAGLWVAIAAHVARSRAPRAWAHGSRVLALSAITGALHGRV